eukprot:scaffold129080_cov44-Attheya_sp.AAC.2
MSSVLIPQPSYHERSDDGAQLCSFILPHSHSYRGQSRWLENGDTWVKSVPFDCYAWHRFQGNIRHYACNIQQGLFRKTKTMLWRVITVVGRSGYGTL